MSLLLAGYVYLGDKNAPKVDRVRSITGLKAIYANWIDQEQPSQFDIKDYVSSHRIQFVRDTNTYSFGTNTVKALAKAHSPSFRKREQIVISEKGKLFWIDAMGNVKPAMTED